MVLLLFVFGACAFALAAAQTKKPITKADVIAAVAADPAKYDYRVLATSRTSTMEKEMNEASGAGYQFRAVMGGETGFGGKEVVVVMTKEIGSESRPKKRYKLLATSRTSTIQKEMQAAGDEGFQYCGQTVFESGIAGREVAIILERDLDTVAKRIEYKLLATSRTSTMQKELLEAGEVGFALAGVTVAKTAFGGSEIICILYRNAQ
jgi:hypothetical protein